MRWLIKVAHMHINFTEDEFKAIIPSIKIIKICDVLYYLECDYEQISQLAKYSSLVRYIMHSPREYDYNEISEDIFEPLSDVENNMSDDDTFSISFSQVLGKDKSIKSPEVAGRLSYLLRQLYPSMQIDLKSPDQRYMIFKYDNCCYSGWLAFYPTFSNLKSRAAVNSPFFGGGAIKPHLSQLLVNLLRPHKNIIADPFCGHGGILREVVSMGVTALGIEVSMKICREYMLNSKFHGLQDEMLILAGDALYLPLRDGAIKQFITDPPYALQTTTKGRDPSYLMQSFLENLAHTSEIVFSMPSEMLNIIPGDWNVLLDRNDYVHKSLSRRIRKAIKQ